MPDVYRIPLLCIQDNLLNLRVSKEVRDIEDIYHQYLSEHGEDSATMSITYELEKQWYPVITTDSRGVANEILMYYHNYIG